VPAVLIAAVLVALFGLVVGDPWTWIERALVVLVAASPCALAIAVPVTVISAIGSASKFGVVIKSGEALKQLGTIRTVALDKTGTLTRNEPAVVDVRPAPGINRDELLGWAAALEATSTHPLAAAIVAASPTPPTAADVIEEAGRGMAGRVDGRAVRAGNARWHDHAALRDAAEEMASKGMTVVVVEAEGQIAGLIGVRDELRAESAETVRMLQAQGIETVMLTGDNARTAYAIAGEAGITDVRAEQLPADKAAAIEALVMTRPTAMVGDGINDAPALAIATVGIAMGVKGSAAAIESPMSPSQATTCVSSPGRWPTLAEAGGSRPSISASPWRSSSDSSPLHCSVCSDWQASCWCMKSPRSSSSSTVYAPLVAPARSPPLTTLRL